MYPWHIWATPGQRPHFQFPVKLPLVPSTRTHFLSSAAPDSPTVGALQRWNGWQKPKKIKPLTSKLSTKSLLPSREPAASDGIDGVVPLLQPVPEGPPASRPQTLAAARGPLRPAGPSPPFTHSQRGTPVFPQTWMSQAPSRPWKVLQSGCDFRCDSGQSSTPQPLQSSGAAAPEHTFCLKHFPRQVFNPLP